MTHISTLIKKHPLYKVVKNYATNNIQPTKINNPDPYKNR